MVVTDTHAILWYFAGDPKLGKAAKSLIGLAELGKIQLIVSIVTLLEILVITEKEKVEADWDEIFGRILKFPNHLIYPVDIDVLIQTQRLSRKLELHDRIIAATAKMLNAPLATMDPKIRNLSDIKIVWN